MSEQAQDFWSLPGARPKTSRIEEGETVSGTVTDLQRAVDNRGESRVKYEIDGYMRWANERLRAALWRADVQVGDHVSITKLASDPPREGGYAGTNWSVQVTKPGQAAPAAAAPAAAAKPAPVSLPSW